MRQQRVPACSAALSALAVCSLPCSSLAAAAHDGPSAAAKDGTFTGMVENGTKKWLGVPYAEPPIGDLRWRKTVPKAQLSSPMATTKYSADCAQIGPGWPSLGGMIKDCHNFMKGCPNMTWSRMTSEDCLYLNVYAPEGSSPSSGLPVIVYYPSGAYEWGAADDRENNAYMKADAKGWQNVVFVTVNYRTGIFGFLASEGLSARSGDGSSGLFGMHDQTVALKWIQRNIKAFGGDPDRVMLYGESAGATSVSLHLVMPESAGLFHAVAIDSGAFNQWTYKSWSDALDVYNNVTRAMGCDETGNETACILSKSTWALLNVSDAYYGNATGQNLPHKEAINNTQWGPVVDGVLLTAPPIQMLHEGKVQGGPKVPILMGSNSDEGTTFLTDNIYDEDSLRDWCNRTFGNTTGVQVAAHYIAEKPPVDPADPDASREWWADAADDIIGDFVMRCPTRDAAEALASQGHDVFMYNFVHQPAESVNWPTGTRDLGAFHGAEVPFVFFDTFELEGGEVALSSAMSQYWTNMASSGDPNTWSGPLAVPPALVGSPSQGLKPPPTFCNPKQHQFCPGGKPCPPCGGDKCPCPAKHYNRTLRPTNDTYWWHYSGASCDGDVSEGNCTSVESCKMKCMADPFCGGFTREVKEGGDGDGGGGGKPKPGQRHAAYQLKYADCEQNVEGAPTEGTILYFLRAVPMPPPPPPYVELPQNCSLYQQASHCFDPSEGYKNVTINVTKEKNPWGNGYRENTTSLNLCCEACSKDSPKCKGWFVPRGNASGKGAAETADHCVLLDHRPEPLRRHNQTEYCVGATPPAWLPPPGCHERFVPMPPGQRVNWTATSAAPPGPPMPPGHHHGGGGHKPGMGAATRKVFHDVKSLGECCDKCYLDVQEGEEKMCRTWEMPGYPSNTTCFLYSGYSLRMSYMNPKTSNYTGRGARRTEQHGPPAPPPPPAPCTTPQPQIKWPKFTADSDANIRFDLCNITTETKLKKDVCVFWDRVFPINASYPPPDRGRSLAASVGD